MKKCRQFFGGRCDQKKDLHFIQDQRKVKSPIHSTNRWMLRMKLRCLRPTIAVIMAIGILSILSACGTIMDTSDRITSEKDTDDENQSDAIIVEVIVESDGDSVVDLEVEINARKNPESVYFDSMEVPYREEFTIPKDVPIPLTSTRVEASVADDGSEVSCTILYNGEEVATHRSQGNGGRAICEKSFRLGPG